MSDVFISYSKADRLVADALASDLRTRGFEVWWDFALYGGDDFHDRIRAELSLAKAVVVVWSDSAVASKWVRGEAEEASDFGTLISTHIPGFDVRKVPINFRALHCEPIANRDRVVLAIERKGANAKPVACANLHTEPLVDAPTIAPPSSPIDPLADIRSKAVAGDPAAQFELAEEYWTGGNIPADRAEAVRWYRLATAQDYAPAQRKLGWMHRNGRSVAVDCARAVRLYRRAAEQGDVDAQFELGQMYRCGPCVTEDQVEAESFYRLAAVQGHAEAQYLYSFIFERDEAEAVRLLGLAGSQGHWNALNRLGEMYERGGVVLKKDEAEAARLYRLAADLGDTLSQSALGRMYENGLGVGKDEDEALRWYRLAEDQVAIARLAK